MKVPAAAHVESAEPLTTMPAPKSKTKVTLEGTQGTLLATLYARYLDAGLARPVLGDRWAAYVVDQIEWDWARFRFSKFFCYLMGLRGRQVDEWTARFLEKHKDTGATIVHLACGLDGRVYRFMDANGGCLPAKMRWIDVDLPDVVPLRRKLLPKPRASAETGGSYTLTASSVLDRDWQQSIPADRPTLLISEGLAFYLEPGAGRYMFHDLTERLRGVGGEVVLDCIGSNVVWWQRYNIFNAVKAVNAKFTWGIDSGREVAQCHPSLRVEDDLIWARLPGTKRMDWLNRFLLWLTRGPVPTMGRLVRLSFEAEGKAPAAVGGDDEAQQ
ncbi:hypothetical protein GGTG_06976 [Gaeumannomyces tritici R3-111a-1]|uniref:Tetracenomycin polyketide synthesis O-methyltransferase TcmP n=1 Tax=Gaeumannomyces tritici (strain R3-111a-1) TaxID=644352 RepID=J3P0C9_GAET3|nr:hypothetical protein GGTG_06976 [Gaeumannomyces tritici R3-111a-1]EJT77062.1 hypothetical protein GGTG_06976 [Gaeumannomyces tritici R3-111a-1]